MLSSILSRKMRCYFIETRDKVILQKIIMYCQRIADNLERFHHDFSLFESDYPEDCRSVIFMMFSSDFVLSFAEKRLLPISGMPHMCVGVIHPFRADRLIIFSLYSPDG